MESNGLKGNEQGNTEMDKTLEAAEPRFDLGTFEGFNFHTQRAIERNVTAEEVIGWNHDSKGEAEFWPSGDRPEMRFLFSGNVTGAELSALTRLLGELGGDTEENFLRIRFALNSCGDDLTKLTASEVEDYSPQIFIGDCFTDTRREAAYELFELYYPELYRMYEATPCDGLVFHVDRFLDSPSWRVDEVRMDANRVALLVAPE